MSDTPRSYSSRGAGFSFARRQRSQRNRRAVLAVIALLVVYALWISRDAHPIAEFIQADRRLEIVVPRANLARHRFVESRIWDGIPAEWVGGWPQTLADSRGLPDWIVGNLAGSGAIAVADDLDTWSDYLVATRMTRTGCLIERALRLSPRNTSEWAGGLWVRHWAPGNIYYAVRGRTLLTSPSRATLVDALTASPDTRVAPDAVKTALAEFGGEDARGVVRLDEDGPLGRVFSEVRFAARTEEGDAVVKLLAQFRDRVTSDLAPYWADAEPRTLEPAFAAPVTLTADLGTNVEQTWRVLSDLLEVPLLSAEQWETWRAEGAATSPAAVLTQILASMGPSFRVAWQGTDLLEMAPTPVLVGSLHGSPDTAQAVLDALPRADATDLADARVVYDAERARVEAPLMSGPSMTPAGAWHGDTFYFTTSTAQNELFMSSGRLNTLPPPRPGNIFLAIDPPAAIREIVAIGKDLAANGLLIHHTAESYRETSALWLERADTLQSISTLATINDREIELECYVKCATAPN